MIDNNSIFNKLIMINYFIPILKIWDVKSKKILKKKASLARGFPKCGQYVDIDAD